ncbi:hypothetical protein ABT009_28675 [Streptomyces sp. NPDC002896]|uniref:hypothetical protein n=1 Tax=Streptomyces sp. NPDC002896 TaxID=3154438 RepID=UPI0033288100
MLLRLAYLAATNTFALLRLLPMRDRNKDTGASHSVIDTYGCRQRAQPATARAPRRVRWLP